MLAERTLRFGGTTVDAKVVYAFRTALSRRPTPREAQVIEQLYRQRLAKLQNEPTAAKALLSVGDSSHDESVSEAELGAWASVMSVILNLDELITKG